MLNLFKQGHAAFGLDISDVSIKIAQLEKTSGGYRLLGYSDHLLQKGLIVNDMIMEERALISNLKAALAKMDFGKVNTSMMIGSIPESKAFVRIIQIPKMSEQQAAAAVPVEAEQYIPIPIDQAYLDWEILDDNEEKMNVLVTAAPREYIDNYLRVLKLAGLRPIALEVESAAAVRALVAPEKKAWDMLIVDMDTYRTSLIVVSNGHLQFTSSMPFAGDAFTQAIARKLGINEQEAEKIKREFGLDPVKSNADVREALIPVVDNLVAEMRNIFKFHDEHSTVPIKEIILCGGTAKLVHLSSYLYEKFADLGSLQIALGNPWINIFNDEKKAATVPLSYTDSLSYTTALGLAMRGAEDLA